MLVLVVELGACGSGCRRAGGNGGVLLDVDHPHAKMSRRGKRSNILPHARAKPEARKKKEDNRIPFIVIEALNLRVPVTSSLKLRVVHSPKGVPKQPHSPSRGCFPNRFGLDLR